MKIKTIPAYEQVYRQIKQSILNGEWKVGEKIPSEIEFANKYGVNRLTIRMALNRLNGIGVLETRTGDGTYVKEFDFQDYIKKITDFYMTPELIDQIYVFRKAVELECASIMIENSTDEEIAQLGRICKEYQELKECFPGEDEETSIGKIVEKDIEFHSKIVYLSHNQLFIYSFEIAREPIAQHVSLLLHQRIKGWEKKGIQAIGWNDMHEEIYEGIRTRDFERCKEAYLKMINLKTEL